MNLIKYTLIKTKITKEPFNNKHVLNIYKKYLILATEKLDFGMTANVLDLFARNQRVANVTNDLNPEFNTTYNMEANSCATLILEKYGPESFDIIIFDPPYNNRAIKDHYDYIGVKLELWQTKKPWDDAKEACAKLLKPGGIFIHLGYHVKGLKTRRGFEIVEGLILSNYGMPYQNDILLTVEKKLPQITPHL
jgi:hypothetical protein